MRVRIETRGATNRILSAVRLSLAFLHETHLRCRKRAKTHCCGTHGQRMTIRQKSNIGAVRTAQRKRTLEPRFSEAHYFKKLLCSEKQKTSNDNSPAQRRKTCKCKQPCEQATIQYIPKTSHTTEDTKQVRTVKRWRKIRHIRLPNHITNNSGDCRNARLKRNGSLSLN